MLSIATSTNDLSFRWVHFADVNLLASDCLWPSI